MIIGSSKNIDLIPSKSEKVKLTYDPTTVIPRDELFDNLKGIAQKYDREVRSRAKQYAEDAVTPEKVSDEELLAEAKQSLDNLYGQKRATAAENYQSKTDLLNEDKTGLEGDRARALGRVEETYDQKADKLAESIAKQGISHSSIAALAGEELQNERAKEKEDVNYLYDKRLNAVNGKIERLTDSYNVALQNYEIAYALELEKELAKLKTKRDRMESEYIKEHADDKEKAYYAYLEEEKQNNRAYEESEGDYTGAKKENFEERYDYLLDALNGKNKKSVQKFVKENEDALRSYLGLYYDRFVKEVS